MSIAVMNDTDTVDLTSDERAVLNAFSAPDAFVSHRVIVQILGTKVKAREVLKGLQQSDMLIASSQEGRVYQLTPIGKTERRKIMNDADLLFQPTDALPGSFEKIEVLADRVASGLPLWHPEDRNDYTGDVHLDADFLPRSSRYKNDAVSSRHGRK